MYEKRITAGQDRDATEREKALGVAVADELRDKIAPFFLRREKGSLKENSTSSSSNNKDNAASPTSSGSGPASGGLDASDKGALSSSGATTTSGVPGHPKPQSLRHKNDLVVWLQLQPLQRKVYKAFLHSDAVKEALNKTNSILAAITVLKKICDHPALLSEASAEAVIAGGKRWGCMCPVAPENALFLWCTPACCL